MMARRVATWTIVLFASKDHAWKRIMTLFLAALLLGASLLGASSRRSTSMQPRRPSFILYLPTPEPSHGDTCEPNDSWKDVCGPLAPGAVYQFYILCRDGPEIDDDLYYVHIGKTDPITISLTSIPPGTDYDLYLYDSEGGFLDFSNKSGNADEHILYTPGAIGKYFIRVYPWQGCSDTDPYSLVASYTPPPPPAAWRHTPRERDVTLTVGQCQTFAVQATDEDCDLRGVEWYVNGEHQISHFTLSGCSGVDTYSRCFYSSGTHLIEATVFDSLEAYSEIVDWNITVVAPTPTPVCNVKVDDFGDSNPDNDLGGPSRWFVVPEGCGDASACYDGAKLQFGYDIRNSSHCSAVYETGFEVAPSDYDSLVFRFKGENVSTGFGLVRLTDESSDTGGLKVVDFLDEFQPGSWQNVAIPLAAFGEVSSLSQEISFTLEFSHTILPANWQDTAFLDSIRFETATVPLVVDNFNDGSPPNALGGPITTFASEGAEISVDHDNQTEISRGSGYYFIWYSVPKEDAYAVWETGLVGLDATQYDRLSFYVKRNVGTDRAHIYLQDQQGIRVYVDIEDCAAVDQAWQLVTIPLADFACVDLSNLQSLQFAFEWKTMDGLIFLDDIRFLPTSIVVDSFCDEDNLNSLGSETGVFVGEGCPGAIAATVTYDHHLKLDYDVTAEECYVGYFSKTPLNLNPYGSVSLEARGDRCGDIAEVGLKANGLEPKRTVSDYLEEGLTHVWQDVSIPLSAFTAITDRTNIDDLSLAFSNRIGSRQGTTYWDNLRYDKWVVPLIVDNFNDGADPNALRGWIAPYASSGAEIVYGYDYLNAYGDTGASQVISYVVPPNGYAVWQTSLEAVNLSNYDTLSFMIKGAAGNERPNIYLTDSFGNRGFINIETYSPVTQDWGCINIPLQDFGGVGLISLETLQIAFEWEQMQGTVYLDNIQFLPSYQSYNNRVFLPLVLKPPPGFLPSKWDFESGVEGWQHQTYQDSQAVMAVERSSFRARSGFYSLAMITDLIGDDVSRSQGETFVDLIVDPPPGVTAPVNLEGVGITCWVYAPACATGDSEHPNTIQLFVKDDFARSEYAAPVDVLSGIWLQISLTPSRIKPPGGSMDAGFDPDSITFVGVRIKATEGSSQRYRGKTYLDACGW